MYVLVIEQNVGGPIVSGIIFSIAAKGPKGLFVHYNQRTLLDT